MSYQNERLKKLYNGKEVCPLTVAKEILEIRDQIEANHQHAGGQLELVYQAYSEIQLAHGHHPVKLDPACSGCTITMNTLIKNWFKLYDKGSVVQKAYAGAIKSKPLVPIKDKKPVKVAEDLSGKGEFKEPSSFNKPSSFNSDKSYGELLIEFEKTASKADQKAINGGNKPKKAQLLAYLNGKK